MVLNLNTYTMTVTNTLYVLLLYILLNALAHYVITMCCSVLGTLAATYLSVAIIVKYYMKEEHTADLTPEHSQG